MDRRFANRIPDDSIHRSGMDAGFVIAKGQNQFVYADDAVLFEIDSTKDLVVDEMVPCGTDLPCQNDPKSSR